LNKTQGAATIYQRGSRTPRPPDALAFCLRYSALVASARFSREIDFCCRAILMAAQKEASNWVSSAPKVARNNPRGRWSSAEYQRCSNLSASASASFIALRASEVRFARYNASAFSARNCGRDSRALVARQSLIFCSIHGTPSTVSPEALHAQPRQMAPIASLCCGVRGRRRRPGEGGG
jgi:hypothetical protein